MSVKLEHLLLLGAAGAGAYLFFGAKKPGRAITSGSVSLAAGVPYRLTYEIGDTVTVTPPTALVTSRQDAIRAELAPAGGYDVRFGKLPALGKYSVSFVLSPQAPLSIAIGSQLSPSGLYAPKMKLIRVERADGSEL